MFSYRNIITGTIINVPCECKGENWEKVETPSPVVEVSKEKTKKKVATKKATK